MLTKKKPGLADRTDPDDAPPLTRALREQAEIFEGDRFIPRGRGRPKSPAPKEQINLRLDARIVAYLRRFGPGWQSRAAALMTEAVARAAAAEEAMREESHQKSIKNPSSIELCRDEPGQGGVGGNHRGEGRQPPEPGRQAARQAGPRHDEEQDR